MSQLTVQTANCSQFSSDTDTTQSSVQYGVTNAGNTAGVVPSAFEYWVKVTAPAGSNTFVINQTITTGNFSFLFGLNSGSGVFNGSCKGVGGASFTQSPTNVPSGTVTVTFNALSAGTYFINVRFTTSTVNNKPKPSPTTTVSYTFSTAGVPGSTSELDLVKKP